MALISEPPRTNPDGVLGQGWASFFSTVSSLLIALTQSGTTANRPIKFLWIGRTYFDTTLGIPIYYDGADWIDAAGNVV